MKREMVLFLTLVLMAAMAVTTANAQQYVHTDILRGTGSIGDIAFKDNGTLISGSWGDADTLRAWSVATGRQRWEKDVGDGVHAVALPSHDPFFIAYGGRDNHDIRMRYSDDGDFRGTVAGHTGNVNSLAFKPNSYLLASGSDDNTIRIWDVGDNTNLRHVRTLRGHTRSVFSVAWSPDGRTLASASWDGTVRLWNPDNGINFAVLRGHTESVRCVAWSPDGRILASGSSDKTVRLWNPDTHGIRRVLRGHTNDVGSVAFHPNGQTLVSACGDTIRLWHPNTGAHKATLTGYNILVLSPNGQILAGGGRGHQNISLWRLLTVDVTGNGSVTISDLLEVARNYGKTVGAGGVNRKADVNEDGEVDVDDVLAVIQAVDAAMAADEDVSVEEEPADSVDLPVEADDTWDDADGDVAGAPAIGPGSIGTGMSLLRVADVREWLRDAKAANAEPTGIAALERLLAALTLVAAPPPSETVLLANYPNPFNPETWIPYQLSDPAEVTVSIYSVDGKLVRTLELGQVPAGIYQSRSRAAYWDGRNAQGESVASGVYFYTLRAGDFSATRKMVIRK